MRGDLGGPLPRRRLARVVEVGKRPVLLANPLAHRLQRVPRIALGVVGVHGEEAHAARAVVARRPRPGGRASRARRGSGCRSRRRPSPAPRRAPAGSWTLPSVSGSSSAGAGLPDLGRASPGPSARPPPSIARSRASRRSCAVGKRRDPPVAKPVDAAGQARSAPRRAADVAAVDADRRRAHEPLPLGVGIGADLPHVERAGVDPGRLHLLAQDRAAPPPRRGTPATRAAARSDAERMGQS